MENTRLIRHRNIVYKVKISCQDEKWSLEKLLDTIEPVLRALLYAEARRQWIKLVQVKNGVVHCSKKLWKTSEKLHFIECGNVLEAYPYMFVFKIQFNNDEHNNKRSNVIQEVISDISHRRKSKRVATRKESLGDGESTSVQNSLLKQSRKDIIKNKASKQCSNHISMLQKNKEHEKSTSISEKDKCSNAMTRHSEKRQSLSGLDVDMTCGKKRKIVESPSIRYRTRSTANKHIESTYVCMETIDSDDPLVRLCPETSSKNCNNNNESSCDENDIISNSRPNRLLIVPRRKDRHEIEQEQIDEDMKLQMLARPIVSNASKPLSGWWKILETIVSPVKSWTERRTK